MGSGGSDRKRRSGGKPRRRIARTERRGLLEGFSWPKFYEPDEVRFLVRRVEEASGSRVQHKLYLAILRRAYENLIDLQILYRELPGLLLGEEEAIKSFRDILDRNLRGADLATRRGVYERRHSPRSMPQPQPGGSPCPPNFLVKPSVVWLVVQGVEQITQANRQAYGPYVETVATMWDKGRCLDHLYGLALDGPSKDGRNRLTEELDLIVRTSGVELTESVDEARPGHEEGQPRMTPTPDDPWPPREAGVRFPNGVDWRSKPDLPTRDPCELVRDACYDMVLGAAEGLRVPAVSVWADGIAGIEPDAACAGAQLTIHGSGFGDAQPENVVVVFGQRPAEVVSWSDSEIVVTVPEGARSGCVGFRNEALEDQRQHDFHSNRRLVGQINAGFLCLGRGVFMPDLPFLPSVPSCTGLNRFLGSLPEIDRFRVNGSSRVDVVPGTEISLTWRVRNANSIRIRRTSTDGPLVDRIDPPGGLLELGAFEGARPVDARYELSASNDCGSVSRAATVRLRVQPRLEILGIEVVQTIQRFDLANPGQNNTVRLVAGKRTIVRVYVDSGIRGGFDNGDGPDAYANVVGVVTLYPPDRDSEIEAPHIERRDQPFIARPQARIDPQDLDHTLNFHVPVEVSGEVRVDARVWVDGDDGRRISQDWDLGPTVNFQACRPIDVYQIRVADSTLPRGPDNPPTQADYQASLQGARTRFPVSELDGFVIWLAPGHEVIRTERDLRNEAGWEDLLDDIDDIADDFEDHNEIWTAVVPKNAGYELLGIGIEGSEPWYWFNQYPRMIAQARMPATFAHELGHTFGIDHADSSPCGKVPDNIDGRLPSQTEDHGVDVEAYRLVPAGTSELMSYCTPAWAGATYQDRWPSIAFWDIMFNRLCRVFLPFEPL